MGRDRNDSVKREEGLISRLQGGDSSGNLTPNILEKLPTARLFSMKQHGLGDTVIKNTCDQLRSLLSPAGAGDADRLGLSPWLFDRR